MWLLEVFPDFIAEKPVVVKQAGSKSSAKRMARTHRAQMSEGNFKDKMWLRLVDDTGTPDSFVIPERGKEFWWQISVHQCLKER